MKLKKITTPLNEAIENIGKKEQYDWVDYAKMITYENFEVVAPVSYAAAVEETKRMREKANKLIQKKRELALISVDADEEDRFKNNTKEQAKFNKGESVKLKESIQLNEIAQRLNHRDKFLIKLNMVDFKDWEALAIDLIDTMDEKELQDFATRYGYDVKVKDDIFDDDAWARYEIKNESKQLKEDLISIDGFDSFKPWNGAVKTWEKIKEEGKLEDFKNIIDALYSDGIEDQTLNDLLWFEAPFIYNELGISEE